MTLLSEPEVVTEMRAAYPDLSFRVEGRFADRLVVTRRIAPQTSTIALIARRDDVRRNVRAFAEATFA